MYKFVQTWCEQPKRSLAHSELSNQMREIDNLLHRLSFEVSKETGMCASLRCHDTCFGTKRCYMASNTEDAPVCTTHCSDAFNDEYTLIPLYISVHFQSVRPPIVKVFICKTYCSLIGIFFLIRCGNELNILYMLVWSNVRTNGKHKMWNNSEDLLCPEDEPTSQHQYLSILAVNNYRTIDTYMLCVTLSNARNSSKCHVIRAP